ncbi:BLUF domain-containing protein [Urechidicola vernalis]|uniref:BLUF domain-containing protein n=1 Tax=Urechidicola vernalis TaxID=3075600 RepID=A0ABU2Y4I7_9FLAO|nr:BLUF domain-containing protein [Urechidicola sp. P050]MDT0552705.1 BLUF domain-containing protein [Urechidicola sp. P050]
MKRITYISKLTYTLTNKEIEQIGKISVRNNRLINITGTLVFFEKMFFQIIDGSDKDVENLYNKIGRDKRHYDILKLKTEVDINERLFPNWHMNTINLNNNVDDLLRPIKILLQSVTETHSIIERYTQPTILKILNKGQNPLSIKPVASEKVILFADIISFTAISEKLSSEATLLVLNSYFEICSRIILKKGGEVNKFMGDGLMAYFKTEDVDNALKACMEIMNELRNLRQNSDENSPLKLVKSGFGLDQGIVIEGNMGSKYKKDYTIIGNAVNTAARLEKLTRQVKHSLVLSKSIKNNSKEPWSFVSLGKFNLKGQKNTSEVFSIDNNIVNNYDENSNFKRKIE